jgi:hypothetical protein
VFYGSLWAAGIMYEERHSWSTYAARLVCLHGALTCSQCASRLSQYGLQDVRADDTIKAPKTFGQMTTV